jgi:hypothetical protein
MSVEHQPHHESNEQSQAELEALAQERLEELPTPSPEQAAEHQEQRAEVARDAIEQQAETESRQTEAVTPPSSFVAKVHHVLNYSQTMQSVQHRPGTTTMYYPVPSYCYAC